MGLPYPPINGERMTALKGFLGYILCRFSLFIHTFRNDPLVSRNDVCYTRDMKTNLAKFHVEDWAGNVMNWGLFDSFEDAWAEIMTRCPNDEDLGEYYAMKVTQ